MRNSTSRPCQGEESHAENGAVDLYNLALQVLSGLVFLVFFFIILLMFVLMLLHEHLHLSHLLLQLCPEQLRLFFLLGDSVVEVAFFNCWQKQRKQSVLKESFRGDHFRYDSVVLLFFFHDSVVQQVSQGPPPTPLQSLRRGPASRLLRQ